MKPIHSTALQTAAPTQYGALRAVKAEVLSHLGYALGTISLTDLWADIQSKWKPWTYRHLEVAINDLSKASRIAVGIEGETVLIQFPSATRKERA